MLQVQKSVLFCLSLALSLAPRLMHSQRDRDVGQCPQGLPRSCLCPAGPPLLPAPGGDSPSRDMGLGGPLQTTGSPSPSGPALPSFSKKPFPPSTCLPPIFLSLVSPSPPSLHLPLMASSFISPVSPSFMLPSFPHSSIFHLAVSL